MTVEDTIAAITERERVRAALAGVPDWGRSGSAVEHRRYSQPARPRSRRRCRCGCGGRETHVGMANGLALMGGCELYVQQWVRTMPPDIPGSGLKDLLATMSSGAPSRSHTRPRLTVVKTNNEA